MSRTGVGCRVMLNGKLLDDGSIVDWNLPNLVGQGVSAVSGLQVTWGRQTVIDQPDSSSCTFKVVDDPGGLSLLNSIEIGSRVDVYADAVISSGAGESVFIDPSFSTELRTTLTNAKAARSQAHAIDVGGWSASVTPVNSSLLATARFPPGPLQLDGTNPAAWAFLRATNPGETWTITIRVWFPAAMTVTLRPVFYSGPYASAAVVGTASTSWTATAQGWRNMSLTFSPGNAAQWIGFQVDVSGGMTWATVDAGYTWAAMESLGWSWADLGSIYVDAVEIVPPAGGAGTTVQVFSGRITDLEGFFDEDFNAPGVNVTASDFRADLGNRNIGDAPWPVETVTTRVTKILTLAAIPGEAPVSIDIAATLGNIPLTLMDVDARSADGLLTDVAQSVDGVLWSASHPVIGPFMRLEDPAQRLPLYAFGLVSGVITIVPVDFSGMENPPPALSACDILRDPVQFNMSVSDIATRVDAVWLQQPTPPATETIERHYKLVNTGQESVYGTRAVSIQTDLTTQADALRVAEQLISRLSASWRIEGVVFADADVTVPDATAARSLLILLNAVTRGGQALLITDLDSWSPVGEAAPVYLEGGQYSFVDGGWSLSLNVSRSSGFGASAQWDGFPNDPAWIWDAFDPALTWDALRGVTAPHVVAQIPILPPPLIAQPKDN